LSRRQPPARITIITTITITTTNEIGPFTGAFFLSGRNSLWGP
jgi:hypothetical protein